MKKILSLALAVLMLAAFAPGVPAEGPQLSGVTVCLGTAADGTVKPQDLVFNLLDADTGAVLDSKTVAAQNAYLQLDFTVPAYEAGKKFYLHLAEGDATLEFDGQDGAFFLLETYSWPDSEGVMTYVSTFYMTLRPAVQRVTYLSLAGTRRDDVPLFTYPEGILIPVAALEAVGINVVKALDGSIMLTSGSKSMVLRIDRLYAYTNDRAFNLSLAPRTIDGVDYVPVGDVAVAFDCPVKYSDDGATLRLSIGTSAGVSETKAAAGASDGAAADTGSGQTAVTADADADSRVASVASDTDYLIWISKSEYMVRVYMGSQGNWHLLKSFQCAIGKSSTPTVTGTFKYYASQDRWSYANYWCGPIMRFRSGGYAIHSTLRRYDGSDYDGRVGVAISHGCVRVRPENIEWMFNTVPLNSTVYITK